jgi:hypothetical protein
VTDSDIVVYTAIFDDYDVLLQPQVKPDNVDFVCFTDDSDMVRGVWEARYISGEVSSKLLSGKVKTLAHRFFTDYKYSIWVDGNIQITKDVRPLIKEHLSGSDLAVPQHPSRRCIYREAEACIEHNLADPEQIREQMDRYQKYNFPQEFGLSETRILIRQHNKKNVIETMELWWDEYQEGAERDQLSFEFATWKQDLQYNQIDIEYDTEGSVFSVHYHKPDGMKGEIWELLMRGKADYSGVVSILSRICLSIATTSYRLISKLNKRI